MWRRIAPVVKWRQVPKLTRGGGGGCGGINNNNNNNNISSYWKRKQKVILVSPSPLQPLQVRCLSNSPSSLSSESESVDDSSNFPYETVPVSPPDNAVPFDHLHLNNSNNNNNENDNDIEAATTATASALQEEAVVEEEAVVAAEEEVYVMDDDKFHNTLSFLQQSPPPPNAVADPSFHSSLDALDLDLHPDFVLKLLLHSPPLPPPTLLSFFNWALTKPRFRLTSPALHALVLSFSTSDLHRNHVYALWDLVRDVAPKHPSVLNPPILNSLISFFSKLGKAKAALEVFDMFPHFTCVPDSDTYYYTLEALCRRSFFDWSCLVSDKMLASGALPDTERVGKIISWFCKGNMAVEAHRIYLLAKENNKRPPQSAVNLLIASLCQKDETVKLSVLMLDDFSGEARKYAIKPFSLVLCGLCRIKDVDGAKELLSKMIVQGPPPGNAVFNTVISGYAKVGDMKEAVETMRLMERRGLKPDVYTYTVIMGGYVSGGEMEEAHKTLSEAKKKHSKLGPVTFHTLIRGYCKLQQFDKALELLREMKEYGVKPNVDEYNKLIQSLCLKAVDWETSEELLGEMKQDGLYLTGITQGLIRAVKELEQEGVTI